VEKIRKALDLAREQRAARLSDTLTEAPSVAPPRTATPAVERSVAPYRYTRTRIFEPDAALLERNRVLPPGSASPAGEAFRMLRTQVAQRMGEHGWRSLAVVSPGRKDGRTLAAVNLAIALAADARYSVLLCDFDLRSGGLAQVFGLQPAQGVDDLLTGRASVEDCLCHPRGFERLVLLPARAPLPGSSEYLAGTTARQLVAELRDRYADRILIFDLPPVLSADDALAFTPLVDCALLVVTEGRTRRDDVVRSLEILGNTPIIGTLLNRAAGAKSSAA
jgi:protein-tyrosine kinase